MTLVRKVAVAFVVEPPVVVVAVVVVGVSIR